MSRNPRRVQINGEWYDAREGWAGTIELSKYGSPVAYTAKVPFAHITNLFHVYNTNGSQVGEFNTDNRSCSGCVSGFEA